MSIVKQSLVGASGQGGGYTIDDSLRFRSSASAYLNRTPATAGNRKTFTISAWVKRGLLDASERTLFSAGNRDPSYQNMLWLNWSTTGQIRFYGDAITVLTTAVYRDPSAWYHIVVAVDTTQATASNRVKMYVNGIQVTSFATSNYPSQNHDFHWNNTTFHEINRWAYNQSQYGDQYLTEVYNIDGQALDPTDFGEFDEDTGVWKAKEYTGTYGTNGFYLPFANPTGGSVSADFLVIAGGGGGAGQTGGGGGAGGYRTSAGTSGGGASAESTLSLSVGNTYAVTVGSGGAKGGATTSGSNGGNSVFSSVTSTGGGGGGTNGLNGLSGGSGGGAGYGQTGGAGTTNQGYAGGNGAPSPSTPNYGGAGGGGAGAVGGNGTGTTGGNGGAGVASTITGSSVTRAGGGGGGTFSGGTLGTGGAGGGGNAGASDDGDTNTGSGGGGASNNSTNSGNGGSGVVIISYAGAQQFSGGTITSSGGNTIHTFTTSGILTTVFNDFSGNGNNWTGNNFNVSDSTATTYDLMKDTPSLVDENAGNFPTWNPVRFANGQVSYSEGNLKTTHTNNVGTSATIAFPSSGKWYFEASPTGISYFNNTILTAIGIIPDTVSSFNDANQSGYTYAYNGLKIQAGSHSSYGATYTTGDLIGVAFDVDAGTLTFYKNGVSQGTAFTGISSSTTYFASGCQRNAYGWYINFGQRPFAYTPPTGFLKLNTFNLPDSTIEDGSDYFNSVLYSGNSSTQSITGVGFQPDFTWIKGRSAAFNHGLFDAVRAAPNALISNSTGAEVTRGLTSFDSDGFSLNGSYAAQNANGYTYVGWNWKANGSGVSNTDGSVTSTVSANTTAGFSIVSYTGSPADTVGHGLGVAPQVIIQKDRDHSVYWRVFHYLMSGVEDYNPTDNLHLNATNAYPPGIGAATRINGVNATTFTNTGGFTSSDQIAYCFAPVEGYSAFGKYTGNGSTDGPFVYTGFRPAFVMVKVTAGAIYDANWFMLDSSRGTYNVNKPFLAANNANAENSGATCADFLSNGFKLRITNSLNDSNATYIYMAFAENPFKNANAR